MERLGEEPNENSRNKIHINGAEKPQTIGA